MKKRHLANLKPGTEFYFAGEKFVVLAHFDNETFALLAQSKESCPFNNKDGAEDLNNYIGSTLQERIDDWVANLPRNSAEADAILPFRVDLSCTDQSKSYGVIEVRAAPLTLWQYGRYKELIPLNEDDWWWLVTPWACRWLRSPGASSTHYVWYVYTNGNCSSSNASDSYGIRPALTLKSSFLVALDEEDEDECANEDDDGEDDMNIDLSKVGIAELLSEIRRRVSAPTDDECEGDDE